MIDDLRSLKIELQKWNQNVFGNIHLQKNRIVIELCNVETSLERASSDQLLNDYYSLQKQFDDVLSNEEMMWFQKSRVKWIECGDRNTSFFHTSTIIRRKKKMITTLKDSSGCWVVHRQDLKKMVIDYFADIYSLPEMEDVVIRLPRGGFPHISQQVRCNLVVPISNDEIWRAIKQMGGARGVFDWSVETD